MARSRSRGTLVDYLVAAIEPVLIMIMVGSLMFFLLDLWYEGPVLDRLRWILFWFVFGIVLITRVSMQIGSTLATGYGVALGGAVALVASVLAGIQPFLLIVMGVVWWATHKLTFDCTLLDEDQDSGVGLLQESGLELADLEDPRDSKMATAGDPDEMDTSLLPQRPWWKLWELESGQAAKRPHAPGVTLVYFTIASLPIFGLGQWFIPAVDEDRRAGLFLYFLAYIASGMGLLLATSFLNLRRYLRRRKIKMPGAMTATWLSTGAILIVGLTASAAVLPLPVAGLRAMRGSPDSSDLRASKYAVLKDSGVQGEGTPSEGPAASKSGSKQPPSGKAKGSGKSNDPNASQQTNGKGKPGGNSGQGRSKSGAPKGKPASSQNGQQGKQGSPQDQSRDQGKSRDQSRDQSKGGDQSKSQDGRSKDEAERGKQAEKDSEQGEKKDSEQDGEKKDSENPDSNDSGSPPSKLPSLSLPGMEWLKIPIMIAGILFLIYGLYRYGGVLLRALRELIAALLAGFWMTGPRKKAKDEAADEGEKMPPPRPFASFVNPFDAGLDHQFSPNDLVLYSFEALEAWAYEHNLARSPHETPMEFVQRIGEARADLDRDATRLVGFFVTIVYGQRGFRAEVLPAIRQFWQVLQA